MIVQDEMESILAEAGKSEARLRLKVGKDIDSYKRFYTNEPCWPTAGQACDALMACRAIAEEEEKSE